MKQPAETVSPHPHDLEHAVNPSAGDEITVELQSNEARAMKVEMTKISEQEASRLMNREEVKYGREDRGGEKWLLLLRAAFLAFWTF